MVAKSVSKYETQVAWWSRPVSMAGTPRIKFTQCPSKLVLVISTYSFADTLAFCINVFWSQKIQQANSANLSPLCASHPP